MFRRLNNVFGDADASDRPLLLYGNSPEAFQVKSGAGTSIFKVNADSKTVTISGNLTVSGTTTTVTSNNYEVSDILIHIASGNGLVGDSYDTGIYTEYKSAGVAKYAGLIRKAGGGWYLLKDVAGSPDASPWTASNDDLTVATLTASTKYLAPNGTRDLPSYSFTSNTGAGMYFASNQLGFSPGGAVPALLINSARKCTFSGEVECQSNNGILTNYLQPRTGNTVSMGANNLSCGGTGSFGALTMSGAINLSTNNITNGGTVSCNTAYAANGAYNAPSYAFTNGTSSGMYYDQANSVLYLTSGAGSNDMRLAANKIIIPYQSTTRYVTSTPTNTIDVYSTGGSISVVGNQNNSLVTLIDMNPTSLQVSFAQGIYTNQIYAPSGTTSFMNNNVSGISTLSATTISGTLAAGAQTGISAVGTLSGLTTTGDVGITKTSPVFTITDNSGTPSILRVLGSGGVNYIQTGTALSSGSKADLAFTSMLAGSEWMRLRASTSDITASTIIPNSTSRDLGSAANPWQSLYLKTTEGTAAALNHYEEYTGSFSFAGPVTVSCAVRITRVGKNVNVSFAEISGTSTVNTLFSVGTSTLPARFSPPSGQIMRFIVMTENVGVAYSGQIIVYDDGSIQIYRGIDGSGFAAGAAKVFATAVTYSL